MTNTLNSIEVNSVIKYNNGLYRVSKEGRAVNMQGEFAAIGPDALVEVVKTPEELAQAYLMLMVPLTEIGAAFTNLANNLVQTQQNNLKAASQEKEQT